MKKIITLTFVMIRTLAVGLITVTVAVLGSWVNKAISPKYVLEPKIASCTDGSFKSPAIAFLWKERKKEFID